MQLLSKEIIDRKEFCQSESFVLVQELYFLNYVVIQYSVNCLQIVYEHMQKMKVTVNIATFQFHEKSFQLRDVCFASPSATVTWRKCEFLLMYVYMHWKIHIVKYTGRTVSKEVYQNICWWRNRNLKSVLENCEFDLFCQGKAVFEKIIIFHRGCGKRAGSG